MTFHVGLLFHSTPRRPLAPDSVAGLLRKIEVKSAPARNGRQITLMPFVRSTDMAAFSQSVAGGGYAIEAAAFDEAGVTFGPLGVFTAMTHPEYNAPLDFDLGMRVLLWRCDVIVIVCRDAAEIAQVRERLATYHNSHVSLALVPVMGTQASFVEVNPTTEDKKEAHWLLAVTERWEAEAAGPPPAPDSKRTVLGFLFPAFYSALIGGRFETIKKRKPTQAERCRGGMGLSQEASKILNETDRKSLDALIDAVCPYFAGHDELGTHYSNVFRTTCFLVPLLIVVSTVLAVAAAVDDARHTVWHILELLLLIAAAVLYMRTKRAKHHGKWVENRLIAELLRPILFNMMFHTIPQLALPSEEPRVWVDRSRLLLRHLRRLPPMAFTTPPDELLSARVSVIRDFSNYQAGWHRSFAGQHRAAEKRLARISAYAFAGTLLLCLFQLLISFGLPVLLNSLGASPGHVLTEVVKTVARSLVLLTLLSAGVAFVVLLLSHQLGFEAIAERSSNAAEHFKGLHQRIQQSGHAADARQVYAWAQQCTGAILAEQHSWYRHIPLIRMHL